MLTYDEIKNIEVKEGWLNNKYLVAFMRIELSFMQHVEKMKNNTDFKVLAEMYKGIGKIPMFDHNSIMEFMRQAFDSSFPESMLDKEQKIRLTYYIQSSSYAHIHEKARQVIDHYNELRDNITANNYKTLDGSERRMDF